MSKITMPLLMTASISTRGMVGACFSDEERLEMYKAATKFYIRHFLSNHKDRRIVFAENSGYNLDFLLSNGGGGI